MVKNRQVRPVVRCEHPDMSRLPGPSTCMYSINNVVLLIALCSPYCVSVFSAAQCVQCWLDTGGPSCLGIHPHMNTMQCIAVQLSCICRGSCSLSCIHKTPAHNSFWRPLEVWSSVVRRVHPHSESSPSLLVGGAQAVAPVCDPGRWGRWLFPREMAISWAAK